MDAVISHPVILATNCTYVTIETALELRRHRRRYLL